MSDPTPPSAFPWLVLLGGLAVGGLGGLLLHDLAGLRPFVPPAFSTGNTLACSDLNAYVEHVSDLQDHRIHATTFGIHRQKTIAAVNELYDRARCGAQKDGGGHETYQTLKAVVEPDTNDPAPRTEAMPSAASPPRAAAVPSVVSAPRTYYFQRDPPPQAQAGVPILSRRHKLIIGDGTLDAMPPTPEPTPVRCPPPVHPNQVYYGPYKECPDYIRLPN